MGRKPKLTPSDPKKENVERKLNGGVTRKQKMFVDELLANPNESKGSVYKRVTGNPKLSAPGASINTDRILSDPRVQRYYNSEVEKLMERTHIRQDTVLKELAALALFDIRVLFDDAGRMLPIEEWPSFASRAVASFNIKEVRDVEGNVQGRDITFKMWDKVRSLELLGKHLRLFSDNSTAATERGKDEIVGRIKELQTEMQARGLDVSVLTAGAESEPEGEADNVV